jgi:tight adherence protein C
MSLAAPALLLMAALLLAGQGVQLLRGPGAALGRRARALSAAPRPSGPVPVMAGLRAMALHLATRARVLEARLSGLSGLLEWAGWRGSEAQGLALAILLLTPLAAALLAALVLPVLLPQFAPLRAAVLGLGLGMAMPVLFLRQRIAARRAAIAEAFPDFLDLLVICVEAGISLDAALRRVAEVLAPASPALADEIGLAAIELGFLPNRADAFANLARRVPLAEVRGLVALFQQTERYGTPLAAALRVQAAEGRNAALVRVEERMARLPALLTVPMILFILPPLFIVLVGPVAIRLLDL